MKKLFGISLAAVLAVSPLMAGATDLTSDQLAKAVINNPADSQTVATVSYVKGAYKELGDAVNTKQDKLSTEQLNAIEGAVQSVVEGTTNGTIAVDGTDVAVHGLGSAAYTDSTAYATAAQGTKADNAEMLLGNTAMGTTATTVTGAIAELKGNIEDVDTGVMAVTEGSTNGTVSVDGTDVAVHGLGSAAYTDSTAYATAAQGALADSAVQSVTTGTAQMANGTISVDGNEVAVKGLGSAAFTDSTAYDAAGTAQSLVDGLGIADYAKKIGVTRTITASTISGTVPVLATWGNNTQTTAPISASITGATYTELNVQPAQQGGN